MLRSLGEKFTVEREVHPFNISEIFSLVFQMELLCLDHRPILLCFVNGETLAFVTLGFLRAWCGVHTAGLNGQMRSDIVSR